MSPDLHTLVGAYAIDALDDDEREEFDQHLATCSTCRLETAELVETAARLGAVAEVVPPEAMRDRVLAAVASSPQERPNVVSLPSARQRGWAPRVLGVAAALLAVLGIGVGISALDPFQDPGSAPGPGNVSQESEDRLVADVLAAEDKRPYDKQLPNGLRLSVVASPSLDAAVVTLQDLPRLDEGRSYQVWRKTAEGVESAGIIEAVDIDSAQVRKLVRGVAGTRSIAVTEEPAGGSPQPTSAPLVDVSLAV